MNGLISFLRSRRTSMHLALLSLPVTPYQQQLWAGWAASLVKRADKDATLRSWVDRCLNDREFGPLSVEASLFDYHETSPPAMRRKSIMCISRYQFKKKVSAEVTSISAPNICANSISFYWTPSKGIIDPCYAQPVVIHIGTWLSTGSKRLQYDSSIYRNGSFSSVSGLLTFDKNARIRLNSNDFRVILLSDEKVIFGKIPNYTTLSEDE